MTDLRELGEMLIEVAESYDAEEGEYGRELQTKLKTPSGHETKEWISQHSEHGGLGMKFNLSRSEYRLKPLVTYYRVFYQDGELRALKSIGPFNVPAESCFFEKQGCKHIKDFEIES